jgi:hypothetical protein
MEPLEEFQRHFKEEINRLAEKLKKFADDREFEGVYPHHGGKNQRAQMGRT